MEVSVLIPCYNEEKTIESCIDAVLNQTRTPDQIVVVNDCSTDSSAEKLSQYGDEITVVKTPKNTGKKSTAQEYGMQFIDEGIVVMTDADTVMKVDFIERIVAHFQDDQVAAVAGYIKSMKYNWITACRELDYLLGQDVHKRAQSHLHTLLIIPGAAAAFRTELFKEDTLSFDHDTVTEDRDFTYKLHHRDLHIRFDMDAVVYTQDPDTLHDYINQIRRWFGGEWQNFLKHWRIIFKRPGHALELSLIYSEGLIFGSLFFILPFINIYYSLNFLLGYFALGFILGLYGVIRRDRWDLLGYAPIFPLVLILNSLIFFEQFIKEMILQEQQLDWFKPTRRSIESNK